MTPELFNLDPVSVYLDYLIRNSLPKNAPLSPKNIILSRVLSGPTIAKYPDTLVIEHRQTGTFHDNALAAGANDLQIDDVLFKSHLTSRLHLNTRRIQADINNCKGWYYGRPILLTIATLTGDPSNGMVNFIVTNSYLGDLYNKSTEGLRDLPQLDELLAAHAATMTDELTKPKPAVVQAVA